MQRVVHRTVHRRMLQLGTPPMGNSAAGEGGMAAQQERQRKRLEKRGWQWYECSWGGHCVALRSSQACVEAGASNLQQPRVRQGHSTHSKVPLAGRCCGKQGWPRERVDAWAAGVLGHSECATAGREKESRRMGYHGSRQMQRQEEREQRCGRGRVRQRRRGIRQVESRQGCLPRPGSAWAGQGQAQRARCRPPGWWGGASQALSLSLSAGRAPAPSKGCESAEATLPLIRPSTAARPPCEPPPAVPRSPRE